MKLRILDGADSIGGTKVVIDTGAGRALLDFGLNYKRFGTYFEEYLNPRPGRGLGDLWWLGLIPKSVDLYREDLWPSDLPQEGEELKINRIFLSHAHMDHCGLLGLVHPEIPVVASAESWAIMKAVQDTGKTNFYSEMAYTSPRAQKDNAPALATTGQKRGREIRVASTEVPAALKTFLTTSPSPTQPLMPLTISAAQPSLNGLEIRTFPVDHSIPGAVAYAFETDAGWVVYSGDLRMHGHAADQTRAFVEEAAKLHPAVLLLEGTRAYPDTGANPTEEDVYHTGKAIVSRSDGQLVIADFSPRQVERLLTFLRIAEETRRKLVVLTKDVYLLEALATCSSAAHFLDSNALGVFDDITLQSRVWDRKLRERHSSRLVSAQDVRTNPGDFILAFSFWDLKNLLDIRPTNGVYIYSSSEAHSEEQEIDFKRLWEWLQFFHMEVHGFHIGLTGDLSFSESLHASGHASGEDLLFIAREIQPRQLIPVHTENPRFYLDNLRGEPIRVTVLPNGGEIRI